jgi:hypothetical protein
MWPVNDVHELFSTLSGVLQRTPNHAVHILGCEHCAGASQADMCVSYALMQAAYPLAVQQLTAQHLPIRQLAVQQLTAQHLLTRQVTAQQLTAQQLIAAVPTGMEHQAPVLSQQEAGQ